MWEIIALIVGAWLFMIIGFFAGMMCSNAVWRNKIGLRLTHQLMSEQGWVHEASAIQFLPERGGVRFMVDVCAGQPDEGKR